MKVTNATQSVCPSVCPCLHPCLRLCVHVSVLASSAEESLGDCHSWSPHPPCKACPLRILLHTHGILHYFHCWCLGHSSFTATMSMDSCIPTCRLDCCHCWCLAMVPSQLHHDYAYRLRPKVSAWSGLALAAPQHPPPQLPTLPAILAPGGRSDMLSSCLSMS